MKKVFKNTDEVIHVFAQRTQKEGRNQSSSVFFFKDKIKDLALEQANKNLNATLNFEGLGLYLFQNLSLQLTFVNQLK